MFLGDKEENHEALVWALYAAMIVSVVFILVPNWAWVSFLLAFPILALAHLRQTGAAHTIYASHMANVFMVGIAGCLVSLFLFLKTLLGLAVGAFITIPASVAMFVWGVYRVLKGILALFDKRAFS